ncbi:MAG: nitroreductase family protein [Bacteroidales bacterium]|nr:nitroreductase family protein [Bacteroidales bacterium]
MTVTEAIQNRQSERAYLDKPVEKEKIQQCIEAARLAPSACNAQGWTFVVVDDKDLKNEIAQCANSLGMNKFVEQAPVIVAIVVEKPNFTSWIGSLIKRKDYSLMDIGIATENLCLQAQELGLGTCIMGWFNEKKVKKLLHIPPYKHLALIVSMGYTDNEQRKKIRKPLSEIMRINRY